MLGGKFTALDLAIWAWKGISRCGDSHCDRCCLVIWYPQKQSAVKITLICSGFSTGFNAIPARHLYSPWFLLLSDTTSSRYAYFEVLLLYPTSSATLSLATPPPPPRDFSCSLTLHPHAVLSGSLKKGHYSIAFHNPFSSSIKHQIWPNLTEVTILLFKYPCHATSHCHHTHLPHTEDM